MVEIKSNIKVNTISFFLIALLLLGSFSSSLYLQFSCLLLLPASCYALYFSPLHSWLLYGPLTSLPLLIFINITHNQVNDIFSVVFTIILIVTLLLGIVIELINNYLNRRKAQNYYKEISESKVQRESVLFNERALKLSGMSVSDQEFFRTEILKDHKEYEYLCRVEAKIKDYIPTYSEDLKIINEIFNKLLNAPLKMLSASDFLYKNLPDYFNIIKSLENILNSIIKDDDDVKIFHEVESKISIISDNLKQNLKDITNSERKDLEIHLEQIKKLNK